MSRCPAHNRGMQNKAGVVVHTLTASLNAPSNVSESSAPSCVPVSFRQLLLRLCQDSVLVPGTTASASTSQRVTVGMSSAAAAAAASDIAAGTGGETLAP